jgi:hypothetical protein
MVNFFVWKHNAAWRKPSLWTLRTKLPVIQAKKKNLSSLLLETGHYLLWVSKQEISKSRQQSASSDFLFGVLSVPEGGYVLFLRNLSDCGAIGGMKIGRGKRSTRRKPAPAPLCPPQIPLDHTQDRTRAAAVGSRRLTVWAMARPFSNFMLYM